MRSKILASDIIDRWCPSNILISVQDVFNDKIDFDCSCFADTIRLNREMPIVAKKYAFFDCTESALGVIQNFLNNLELLQTFLGEIEASLQETAVSYLELLQEGKGLLELGIAQLNLNVEYIQHKERENEEKRSLEIEKMNERRNILKLELSLKNDCSNLSAEEAKKLVYEVSPTFRAHVLNLVQWTGVKSLKMLYRASSDGFSASKFHEIQDIKTKFCHFLSSRLWTYFWRRFRKS